MMGDRDIQLVVSRHRAAKLIDAVMRQDKNIVQELLATNTDPNWVDETGRCPLHAGVCKGNAKIVRHLLDFRADPNLPERRNDVVLALQIAAWQGYRELTGLLLQSAADANAAGGSGWTPLCSAAHQGHVGAMQVLLQHGADPRHCATLSDRRAPLTPLQAAAEGGHTQARLVIKEALDQVARSPSRGVKLRLRQGHRQGVSGNLAALSNSLKALIRRCGCCGACKA